MFQIKYVQLYFNQDCQEDETAFSKYNSKHPPEELLRLLLYLSFIFVFFWPGYSIFTLLRSIKLFLRCTLDLLERVFSSGLCCSSVLIKLVSSKGKLLSVHFYHRPLPPSSTEQFITAHHTFLKLVSLHVDLHIALVMVWEQSRNFQKDILLILYISVL